MNTNIIFPLCITHIILKNATVIDHILVWGLLYLEFCIYYSGYKSRGLNIRPRTITFIINITFLGGGWIKLLLNSILFNNYFFSKKEIFWQLSHQYGTNSDGRLYTESPSGVLSIMLPIAIPTVPF